jgi:hypothetical protein
MKKFLFVSLVCVISLSAISSGAFVLDMIADNPLLSVGESTIVHVSAFVDDPAASGTNGLVLWQMDIDVDIAGILGITDNTFVAPDPSDMFDSGWSYNAVTGDASTYALKDDDSSSTIGVDVSTEIFNFEVTALSEGTATYTLRNGIGDLVDGTPFDAADLAYSIEVIPEPSSLVLLAIGGLALNRRRK